jgi:hypothetical protein
MLANVIGSTLSTIMSFNNWLVVVYDDVYSYDSHDLRTANGFVLLHFIGTNYKYNIAIARADKQD